MGIQLDEITRQFGSQRILQPLTFSIRDGDFLSLLGPSGCGKSTLLRIIAGLDRESSGQISFSPTLLQGGRRSFVFQESHLLPWRTALENVRLPLELSNLAGEPLIELNRAAIECLARVGLRDSAQLYPRELSGGMKMRVSLARALVTKPRLLLLDEPFAALDEHTRYSLQEDLRELWQELQMTVVFVTHSLSEAVFLSTRTLVLSARPAQVLTDCEIELSHGHRDFQTRTSQAFNAEVTRLHHFLEPQEARIKCMINSNIEVGKR